jgi:uncharacterized protein YuzE
LEWIRAFGGIFNRIGIDEDVWIKIDEGVWVGIENGF